LAKLLKNKSLKNGDIRMADVAPVETKKKH
jgi:hypothetical protein